jgi:hypothetical protein
MHVNVFPVLAGAGAPPAASAPGAYSGADDYPAAQTAAIHTAATRTATTHIHARTGAGTTRAPATHATITSPEKPTSHLPEDYGTHPSYGRRLRCAGNIAGESITGDLTATATRAPLRAHAG